MSQYSTLQKRCGTRKKQKNNLAETIGMKPGDCINIPAGVKHWHGAAKCTALYRYGIFKADWCKRIQNNQ